MAPLPVSAGFLDDLSKAVDSATRDIEKAVIPDAAPATAEDIEDDFDIATEDPVREPFTTLNQRAPENDGLYGHVLAGTREQWGQNFSPEKVIVHHKDVTCDGKKDYIASYINLDNPDGYFFNLMIVSGHEGEVRVDPHYIPFEGANEQFGLCLMEDEPFAEIYYDVWPQTEIDEYLEGMNVCSTAIEIVDGLCDSPRFFWSNEAKKGEPRWVFHRH